MDPTVIQVVNGGVKETSILLSHKFDHILFTGSTNVGRIVMMAAAKHLTPVTLELGGKSPCILDETVDLNLTARRIAWGKWVNCGQTCIAPDYLLLFPKQVGPFIECLKIHLLEFFGENPSKSEDYSRIINADHWTRLTNMLNEEVLFHLLPSSPSFFFIFSFSNEIST